MSCPIVHYRLRLSELTSFILEILHNFLKVQIFYDSSNTYMLTFFIIQFSVRTQ